MGVASLRQDNVLFATDMPPDVDAVLQEAVILYDDTQRAEQALWKAFRMAPDRLEVYVALYKFYFYKNRIEEAEDIVHMALCKAAEQGGFQSEWQQLTISSSQWSPADDMQRFYLYSLKALAFIQLRLGKDGEAGRILDKLQELDPEDQVGGSVIKDLMVGSMDDAHE